MLILTPSWVPRFPRNPLGGQNKHFTQLYNGLFDLVYFRISIIIILGQSLGYTGCGNSIDTPSIT